MNPRTQQTEQPEATLGSAGSAFSKIVGSPNVLEGPPPTLEVIRVSSFTRVDPYNTSFTSVSSLTAHVPQSFGPGLIKTEMGQNHLGSREFAGHQNLKEVADDVARMFTKYPKLTRSTLVEHLNPLSSGPEDVEATKMRRNINRRLYDVINVMISAGFLAKNLDDYSLKMKSTLSLRNEHWNENSQREYERLSQSIVAIKKSVAERKNKLAEAEASLEIFKCLIQKNKSTTNGKLKQQLQKGIKCPVIFLRGGERVVLRTNKDSVTQVVQIDLKPQFELSSQLCALRLVYPGKKSN